MSQDPRAWPPPSANPFAENPAPIKQEVNPYASPQYAQAPAFQGVYGGAQGGLWRQGKLLVMHKLAPLPDICLLSNQPATGRLKRSLRWHHPAVFLALLANLIIYAVLAMVMSKTATIYIGISDEWRNRRWRRILFAWSAIFVSWGLVGVGISFMDNGTATGPALLISGIVLFFVAAIAGLRGAQLVAPKRMTDDYIWLKGVHPEFLDRLPVWPYPT